jgi:hypothetical protein
VGIGDFSIFGSSSHDFPGKVLSNAAVEHGFSMGYEASSVECILPRADVRQKKIGTSAAKGQAMGEYLALQPPLPEP